jgi:hypothetical protein
VEIDWEQVDFCFVRNFVESGVNTTVLSCLIKYQTEKIYRPHSTNENQANIQLFEKFLL